MVRPSVLASLVALTACGGGADPAAGADAPGADAPPAADATPADAAPPPDAPPVPPDAPPDYAAVTCATPPPPGAPVAPPAPPYSGGTCPTLAAGENVIMTAGGPRRFILVLPSEPASAPRPLFVMWHWLGGRASSMVDRGMAQEAADSLGMIIAAPEKKGDQVLPLVGTDVAWPFLTTVSEARYEEEAGFFDDLLACIEQQFGVDENCVSTVGVSAGALWASQLVQRRGDRLASALVISGGVGPALELAGGLVDVDGWSPPARPLPALVLWGGESDRCVVDFHAASGNLLAELSAGGHFAVECRHNCGHAQPPLDETTEGIAVLYRFAVDHPYWLPAGVSPYLERGLPADTPAWCAIGAGNSVERTGTCTETGLDSGCPPI